MKKVIDIPAGTKNLKSLFPKVDFGLILEYYVVVKDSSGQEIAATTYFTPHRCDRDEYVRLLFLNQFGRIDGINAKIELITNRSASERYKKALRHPKNYELHQAARYNVSAIREYKTRIGVESESDMEWITQLLNSPMAWMETDAGSLPIVISDAETPIRKSSERYLYEVEVVFEVSHETITHRV